MKNKKELIELVLVFMIGVIFIILMAFNVKQYDKKHPIENKYNNIEKYS